MKIRVTILLTALGASAVLSPAQAGTDITISAPIFPRTDIMYQYAGDNYPATDAAERDLADAAFMSFETVHDACLNDNEFKSLIHVATGDTPLTQRELANNYDTIAACSYIKFTSKPYFIPQLVANVDLCARLLKPTQGWRMITDTDVLSWDDAVFNQLSDTLNSAWNGAGEFWGSFYYSTATYIRTDTGLRVAAMYPGVAPEQRITDLPDATSRIHQEPLNVVVGTDGRTDFVPISLRCIKTN